MRRSHDQPIEPGARVTKILLVEDNPLNADMLSRRLTRRGFLVVTASDGLRAVAAAGSERPDLILMDIGLPEIDGYEATRRIKASPASSPIPVIALTAHALLTDRERAFLAGCDGFETKPIDFDRLLRTIGAALGTETATAGRDTAPRLAP